MLLLSYVRNFFIIPGRFTKKVIRRLLICCLLISLAGIIVYLWEMLPVLSAYGTKALCSSVFLQGRDPGEVEAQELGDFPFNLGIYTIDRQDSAVTGTIWGFAKKKAAYRAGLGAVLLNGISETQWRKLSIVPAKRPHFRQDTVDWPNGDRVSAAAVRGVDMRQLDTVIGEAFREGPSHKRRTRAVVVVYDGRVIVERYAPGFSANVPQMGWSMTKGITNALIGILVQEGKLDPAAPAPIGQWKEDERSRITLANLLNMNSGLRWKEYYYGPGRCTNMLFNERSMGEYAIQSRLRYPPGKVFNYSSGTANILSYIIRRVVGDSAYYRFPYERLFYRTGMFSAVLEADAGGTYVGSSYCYATPRDWARFGLLYLNDGIWNGERILPEGWVSFTRKGDLFGALWWLNDHNKRYRDVPADCFCCLGYEGQAVWVIPSRKLVVVRMALERGDRLDQNKFLAAVIRALPAGK